ncbi:MAG: isochorismatase family protein [Candidatus Woesearchaeota archaeon]|nr:isochorismatase family protein [Candidatus Woesearchaeota archaeon]
MENELIDALNGKDKSKVIFFDVDTQHDFMQQAFCDDKNNVIKGALYINNAESIIHNLEDLTMYAEKNSIRILGSVDRHFKSDVELISNGGQFPEHCMDGTYGQRKIRHSSPKNVLFIENRQYAPGELEEILNNHRNTYFEKQTTDVFDNPNIEKTLKILKPEIAVVYGVATDYCVKNAAIGLRKHGLEVYLVEDSIKGITKETGDAALAEMEGIGIKKILAYEITGKR